MNYYTIGADHVPLPCFDLRAWSYWHANNAQACRVADQRSAHYRVSTMFLGLDHNYTDDDDPILFESLVFFPGGGYGDMARYRTWAEARAGHERICGMLEHEVQQARALAEDMLRRLCGARPASRNAREGRYHGKLAGRHWRRRYDQPHKATP